MKVLIVGSGGRCHALARKASATGHTIFVLGGSNAGISKLKNCTLIKVNVKDVGAVVEEALKIMPDLVIIGPEDPLALGLADACRQKGLNVFGPSQAAAQLEASKSFAKRVMVRASVPTAEYWTFRDDQIHLARKQAREMGWKCVFKADGLAEGKGVTVCQNEDEVEAALQCFFVEHKFGDQGKTVLIEELLIPDPSIPRAEFSELCLVDENGDFIMLLPSYDHKPVNDGDTGPNTGGMGACTSPPWLTQEIRNRVKEEIVKPVIADMKAQGTPFTGVLYAGLMQTEDGSKVVEFNVRFGDPEIQAVLAMLESDLMHVLLAIAKGESIKDVTLVWKDGEAVCLVLASEGYPNPGYIKGLEIKGLFEQEDHNTHVIVAGAEYDEDGTLRTSGGRVVNFVTVGVTTQQAGEGALAKAEKVTFGGKLSHFRKDIGLAT